MLRFWSISWSMKTCYADLICRSWHYEVSSQSCTHYSTTMMACIKSYQCQIIWQTFLLPMALVLSLKQLSCQRYGEFIEMYKIGHDLLTSTMTDILVTDWDIQQSIIMKRWDLYLWFSTRYKATKVMIQISVYNFCAHLVHNKTAVQSMLTTHAPLIGICDLWHWFESLWVFWGYNAKLYTL